ncbi:MAG: histidine triad nucleotide-binding protein [Sphingomonadaceae bacterium]
MTVRNGEPYDRNNIFARILRGEIPCKKIFENDHILAFHDINPQAPIHALVVPKGEYVSLADFSASAPDDLTRGFWRGVGQVARELGLEEGGYRVLINAGTDSHQEVPHLHAHIFAGRPLGAMLVNP